MQIIISGVIIDGNLQMKGAELFHATLRQIVTKILLPIMKSNGFQDDIVILWENNTFRNVKLNKKNPFHRIFIEEYEKSNPKVVKEFKL